MANPSTKIKVSADVAAALKGFEDLQKRAYQLGSELESFGARTGKIFDPLMDGLVKIGTALAAAGTAVATFATVTANELDDAYSKIARLTGGTGKEFDGLKASFEAVAGSADESFGEIADVVANLNTRLGVSGKALEEIASQILDAADLTGEAADEIVTAYTRMMGDWGVPAEQATKVLDQMYVASSQTGAKIASLATAMTQYGAPMRQLGFDLQTTIALMAKWEKEGVNMELVLGSLRIALGKMAKDGVTDTVSELNKVIAAIKEAGTTGEANALALETFGARAGADMAAAIREGRFEVEDLKKALDAANGSISKTAESTKTLGETFGELKNTAAIILKPLGDFVLTGVKGFRDLAEAFLSWAESADIVAKSVASFAEGLGIAVPSAEQFQKVLNGIDVESVANWFREMGETIRAVAKGFKEFAEAVPWKFILENLKEITYVIFTSWAIGKISTLAGGLMKLAEAWTKFGASVDGANVAVKTLGLGPITLLVTTLSGMVVQGVTEWGQYTKAVEEVDKAIEKMSMTELKAAEQMAKNKIVEITARYEGNLSTPPEAKKWEAELSRIQAAIKKVESQSADSGDAIAEDMKKLEAFYKSLNGNIEQVAETAASVAPQVQKSFGEKVTDAVQGSIQDLVAGINELRTQSKDLVTTFGIDAVQAGENLKSEIKKRATEASDKLVKDFDNPGLKTLFGQALARLGKAGGDAMLQEIGTSLATAEKKLGDFKTRMDEYTKQLNEMKGLEESGEAHITSIWGDKTTWAVQSGMKYQDPKKGSYEDRFNEPVYEYKTLTKPVEEASKAFSTDSMGSAIDAMIQKLSKGLESFDASKISAPIESALQGIETSGGNAGGAAGNKFGQAFVEKSTAAIEQVVQAIENIPNVVQVTIQRKATGGSGSLAGAVQSAARG